VLLKINRTPEASAHYRDALQLDEKILAMDPKDPAARYGLTLTLSDTGFTYWKLGDRSKALEYYRRVLGMRDGLLQEDPSNMRARHGVASTCNYLGEILREQGDWRQAAPYYQRAIALMEGMLKTDDSTDTQLQLAWRYINLGDDYVLGARQQQAAASYRAAASIVENLKAKQVLSGTELQAAISKRLAAR
jgi:tetratricopeptide (TPR) repeat protein